MHAPKVDILNALPASHFSCIDDTVAGAVIVVRSLLFPIIGHIHVLAVVTTAFEVFAEAADVVIFAGGK